MSKIRMLMHFSVLCSPPASATATLSASLSTCGVSFSTPSLPSFSFLYVFLLIIQLEPILMSSIKYFSIECLCVASNLSSHFRKFFCSPLHQREKERSLRYISGWMWLPCVSLRNHTGGKNQRLLVFLWPPHMYHDTCTQHTAREY